MLEQKVLSVLIIVVADADDDAEPVVGSNAASAVRRGPKQLDILESVLNELRKVVHAELADEGTSGLPFEDVWFSEMAIGVAAALLSDTEVLYTTIKHGPDEQHWTHRRRRLCARASCRCARLPLCKRNVRENKSRNDSRGLHI